MVESRLERKELSARDRLCLKQTLCALPKPQFDDLVFALNPPKGNLPGDAAPQSDRAMALLGWAESAIGPGIAELEAILQSIIATHTRTAEYYLSFAISGRISNQTADEVRAIVELLRKKTGDNSIDVAFFREGSVKVVLSGSPEGLERLQELLESGDLEGLGLPPVEEVERVEGDSEDARKARLVQVLRMRDRTSNLDLALTLIRKIESDLIRDRDLIRIRTRTRSLALITLIVALLILAFNHVVSGLLLSLAFSLALALVLVHTHKNKRIRDNGCARDLNFDLNFIVNRARELVLSYRPHDEIDFVLNRVRIIVNSLVFSRALDCTRETASDLYRVLYHALDCTLSNCELRGANLSYLDLKGVDLTGADLTYADVMGTRFGGNPGLTAADKRDLISRGAIFEEPPTSDVESLVLR